MRLKKIEEIATKKVPVWQPILLVILLLLGYFLVPLITKKNTSRTEKNDTNGSTLGANVIQDQLTHEVGNVIKPVSDQLKKEAGVVLGIAQESVQQTVHDIASSSATQAKEFVFDNTLGKLLQNINTLPGYQQELIKNAICK